MFHDIDESFFRHRKENRKPLVPDSRSWHLIEGLDGYNEFFELVLEGETIQDIVNERQSEGKTNLVCDFMGYGYVLNDLLANNQGYGVAVSLSDARQKEKNPLPKLSNVDVIAGDVLRGTTWRQLSNWLEKQPVEDKRFNLVLIRPGGGHLKIPFYYSFQLKLLEKIWKQLSEDRGVILLELPNVFDHDTVTWIHKLQKQQGIRIVLPEGYQTQRNLDMIKIIKTPGAPNNLSSLQQHY